jgi:murein DD-endopeptidase MepM/ murein hydrolase activator NlpD
MPSALTAPSVGMPSPAPRLSLASPAPRSTPSGPIRYVYPVAGHSSYGHVHDLYPATDIFAACGTPIVAPVAGVVLEVNRVDRFVRARPDGARKGGEFVSIAGVDRVRHYFAHFSWIVPGLRVGAWVTAGQRLGSVGHTGNANGICHTHYGLSPICAGADDWWLRRGVVYPWPFLDAWRAGRSVSPGPSIAAWHRARGCPRLA